MPASPVPQFERDVRALVAFFGAKGNPGVKAKLTRLVQLAKVLSLDSPQELLEFWGANEGPIPWEFNAAEVKRLLGACPRCQGMGVLHSWGRVGSSHLHSP
jgi:hypothetical protein